MAVLTKEVHFDGFGKCLEISNGVVDLLITLDFGPRIIRYGFINKENMFFEDKEKSLLNDSNELKAVYGENAAWYIYGGHRLWISPEYITTYYPDNDSVSYKKTARGVLITPPVRKVIRLLCEMEIILDEKSSEVTINHRVTNISGGTQSFSVWALTVMDKGGIEVLEWNTHKNGWLQNRNLILWDYTNMADSRVTWGKDYIILKQDDTAKTPFKLGMDNRKGWAAYINKGTAFVKRFQHDENAQYPDNGCSFETYTNNVMLEVETVGALKDIRNGETSVHTEKWSLIDGVNQNMVDTEEKVKEFIKDVL